MNKELRNISTFLEFDIYRDVNALISSTSDYTITYDEFCERLLNDLKADLKKLKEIQIKELESTNIDMDIKSICIRSTSQCDDSNMNTNILFHSNIVLEETDEKFKNRKKEARLSARRNKEKTERAEYERLHKKYGSKDRS